MKKPYMYILDENRIPQPVTDTMVWARYFESKNRSVAYYESGTPRGAEGADLLALRRAEGGAGFGAEPRGDEIIMPHWSVSTVFVGLDRNAEVAADLPPTLFETVVYRDGKYERGVYYPTWKEAVDGHDAMVRWIKELPADRLL